MVGFSYHLGKVVRCVYFEVSAALSYDNTYKLIKVTEETFCKSRKLRTLGWCRNYMEDITNNDSYLSYNFVHVNHLPNRRQENNIIEFELYKGIFCKLRDNLYLQLSSEN